MGAFPTSPRTSFVQWCEVHAPVFIENAAAIGLTTQQAESFKDATSAVADALLAQEQVLQAYRVATREVEEALLALRSGAGEAVGLIRAFAESQSNPPTVYNTAQIGPPASSSPAPPPAQPTNLSVTLGASDGSLTLRWKASNPAGTSGTAYIIRRKRPGEPEFSFIGVSGRKQFVDDTLVAGTDSVQYTVQGQRADASSPLSEIFTVNFGQSVGVPPAFGTLDSHEARSTVNGQPVQKVLPPPNGNGRSKRDMARN